MKTDTVRTVATPEGVELELRLAGPVPRALAYVLDLLIRVTIFVMLGIAAGALGEFGAGVFLIGFFLLAWFYPVLFEVTRGATPGKAWLGLAVVNDNGTPIGWRASLLRNLLRTVDGLPLPMFNGLGFVTMLANRDFKRLGDLAAGTVVIHVPGEMDRTAMPRFAPMAPPPILRAAGMHSVLHFAERSHSLSPARQAELASILEPITGQRDQDAVDALLSYANWLARG